VYVEDVREVLHEVFRGEPIVERWRETLPLVAREPVPASSVSTSDGN
jgi:hypothetical protein